MLGITSSFRGPVTQRPRRGVDLLPEYRFAFDLFGFDLVVPAR